MKQILLALAVVLAGAACDQQVTYEQLNEETDCLPVRIEPADAGDDDSAAGDDEAGTIALHAAPGYFSIDEIGRATVTPVVAPAQSVFTVSVTLMDTGEETGNPVDLITRATVRVNNGSIDLDELEMDEVPGGLETDFRLELGTGGEPATTTRDDELCVALYRESS